MLGTVILCCKIYLNPLRVSVVFRIMCLSDIWHWRVWFTHDLPAMLRDVSLCLNEAILPRGCFQSMRAWSGYEGQETTCEGTGFIWWVTLAQGLCRLSQNLLRTVLPSVSSRLPSFPSLLCRIQTFVTVDISLDFLITFSHQCFIPNSLSFLITSWNLFLQSLEL